MKYIYSRWMDWKTEVYFFRMEGYQILDKYAMGMIEYFTQKRHAF